MRFPTPHTIILGFLLAAAAVTWMIPAGQYATLTYDESRNSLVLSEDGGEVLLAPTQQVLDSLGMPTRIGRFMDGSLTRPVKVPGTYRELESAPQGPIDAVLAVITGMHEAVDIIFFVLVIGGFVRLFTHSGVLQAGVRGLAARFRGHERWLIVIIGILCAAGGTIFSMGEETIAFYPVLVPVFLAAGYDRLVPLAVIYAGSQVGILASTISPFSVIIASDAAGVAWDAGLMVRLVLLAVTVTITLYYILRYAERVRKDPSTSLVSAAENGDPLPYETALPESDGSLTSRQKWALGLFTGTFGMLVVGITRLHWWMVEMSALFFVAAVIAGLVIGYSEKELVREFITGAADMVGVSLVIGLARGITVVLENGMVIDSVLMQATGVVSGMPESAFLIGVMLLFFGMALVISSSSGLALLSMPILGGLAMNIGVPGESVITAYTSGVGLMYLISPTNLLLPSLAMVNVSLKTWLRFALPLVGLLFTAAVAVLLIA
jgi:uncharacterized ion transporter superfamily protein YfcC